MEKILQKEINYFYDEDGKIIRSESKEKGSNVLRTLFYNYSEENEMKTIELVDGEGNIISRKIYDKNDNIMSNHNIERGIYEEWHRDVETGNPTYYAKETSDNMTEMFREFNNENKVTKLTIVGFASESTTNEK